MLQPALKRYQQQKQPSYIQQKAGKQLPQDRGVVEPDLKRRRSHDGIPLEKAATVSGTTDFPVFSVDFTRTQVC